MLVHMASCHLKLWSKMVLGRTQDLEVLLSQAAIEDISNRWFTVCDRELIRWLIHTVDIC